MHRPPTTRLAPSPTGALHVGNARTFLATWLLARGRGWRVLCRIEDIDGPRLKGGADAQALDDLAWLGLDFDAQPVWQSHTPRRYLDAAEGLLAAGHAYPCVCTRSDVERAASAPHASDGASVYPGTCRGRYATVSAAHDAAGRPPCVRFRLGGTCSFHDLFKGPVTIDADTLGDFPILKADGTPSYQLACALDDATSGVTHVVRGDDLLDSTPRQLALLGALGLADRAPAYCHLPLVLGPDGRRLAKRHGDTRLSAYRAAGTPASRVLHYLARTLGITDPPPAPTPADLVHAFDLARVPATPVTFTAEDDRFLRTGR